MTEQVEVADNHGEQRYQAETSAGLAVLDYRRGPERIQLIHTGVPPEVEGRGIGGALVRRALDDARRDGLCVVPSCPFVGHWIERNPEYADLVCGPR